ncbi:ABC transporter ATP-binding protein [Streptomyces sp. NPDC059256]|uniref:ABC transporter ATP-binding protein n=1 Tax=Streptomyces sp. NPDC059256 TaxID=3346794 RepID=UPI0036814072
MGERLRADDLLRTYDPSAAAERLGVNVPEASLTAIVGPHTSGKSALLHALARLVDPPQRAVVIGGRPIATLPATVLARRLGLLPASTATSKDITVVDLVARARFPDGRLLRPWSAEDDEAVRTALHTADVAELAHRHVDDLSGGLRQRVWVAVALARRTPMLLLDEPTTLLDLAHQVDVLDLCAELREAHGRTVVAVLPDLNQACRYATHVIAMRDGRVIDQGPPARIVTTDLVEDVFGLRCRIINDPETDTPLVLPLGRAFRREPMQPPAARTRTTASTKITDKPMDHAQDHRAAAGSTRENATTGAPRVRA